MAFYLGTEKLKINLNGTAFIVAVPSMLHAIKIVTADGFSLTDSNGIYLTLKESD